MKRILYLAPHSFPIHSSESICNAKVAYILTQLGYNVDVISIDDGASYPSAEKVDSVFLSEEKLSVFPVIDKRHSNGIIAHIQSIIVHLTAYIKTGYYYKGVNYSYLTLKKAESLIHKYGVDSYVAMIARGYRTEVAALYLKKKYGLKWIANWNDPYPIEKFPYPYGEGINAPLSRSMNIIMNDIQKYADVHTFPSKRLRDYMLRYMTRVKVSNTSVIPHVAHSLLSFDEQFNETDTLVLVHAGNVSHPRNPNNFLEAVSSFVHSASAPKLMCYFIGRVPNDFDKNLKDLDITKNIKYISPKDYFSTLKYIRESHVSVIIEAICDEGIYLPTKVVDSIQCGRPIFCVSPAVGTLNDIINKNDIGYCADNTSIDSIASVLLSIYSDFKNNRLPQITKEKVSYFFEDSVGEQYIHLISGASD